MWSFVVDFKVVACIGVQGDCVLCPVQFCYFRIRQTLKNNAYASGCCFRLENWCRNISGVNICFQRGSNLAESRNRMISVKDAEYSGCLSTSRMCRNVEHIYGIWHESRA